MHLSVVFWLNTLKGIAIILTVAILYFNTLTGTNRNIVTPERYDEHPDHSYRGVSPGILGGGGGLLSEYLFRLQKDEPSTGRAYKRGAL